MKTDDEIMRLFEQADPADDDGTRWTDAAGYLASIHTRSTEMKLIDMEAAPTKAPRNNRWVAIAMAAAAAIVLIVAGVVVLNRDDAAPPATTPPTTAPATYDAAADLAVIEEGVAAFYSGDAERAAELFELDDRTDDEIRAESAYQAAIGGRVELRCTETGPGSFNCTTPYFNAMTEAAREGGGNDVWPVRVKNGVITRYGFTVHTSMLVDMATYLASVGRFDGFEDCVEGPFDVSCATIENANIDGWMTWSATVKKADRVAAALGAWYRGDCEAATVLTWGAARCTATSVTKQTTEYESILQAEISVDQCRVPSTGEHPRLSCDVTYSNAMNRAVTAPAAVTTRDFLLMFDRLTAGTDEAPWYEADYPEDTTLRDSFTAFAEQGELAGQYSAASCATTRSAECARLIVDNIDAWAAWYPSNA